ncbi:MAG: S9 family peptidase, partial [Brevundimonas sp.]
MARITVVGEERALVVTRLATGEHLAAAVVGEAKVRDLRWIGEDRVLIVTSQTRAIPTLGVPKSELYFGLVLDINTRKFAQVLGRTDGVLSVLYGPASVRPTDDGQAIFVRGVSVEGNNRVDLYRVDPANGRGRSVTDMAWDVSDYVLDADGQVIATAEYDDRRRRWSLGLVVGRNRFRETWAVEAPVDTPV